MAKSKRDGDGEREAAGDEERVPQANSAARADTIRTACRQITELEAERSGIGESIREIKQKLVKGDLGMKLADFNAALRLYRLESDDRNEFFDTLRETFAALGIGEQLDWLKSDA